MLTVRTIGWLLFNPLVVIMLTEKSVPGERLSNVNVLHSGKKKKKKSHIKIFSSETLGKCYYLTRPEEIMLYMFGFHCLSWKQCPMLKHKWLIRNHIFSHGEISYKSECILYIQARQYPEITHHYLFAEINLALHISYSDYIIIRKVFLQSFLISIYIKPFSL